MEDMGASLYFNIAEHFQHCSNHRDVHCACEQAAKMLGFDNYQVGAYFPIVGELLVISNFPSEWRQRYDEENFIAKDPTVKHCWTHSTPIMWDEIQFSKGRARAEERQVMAEAKKHKLNSGISLPVHGAGAEGSMLSLCSGERKLSLTHETIYGLRVIAQAIHECMRRIVADAEEESTVQKELTAREKECLSWTAAGKTSWEISQILRLSESTITFHLKNAIDKMEVTNRSQAVAKALTHSQIMPFYQAHLSFRRVL